MTFKQPTLGKIDCKGMSHAHPTASGNTDQFVIAEVRPSLHVRESSLSISDPARVVGGSHGLLMVVADGIGDRASGERASTVAIDALTQFLVNSFDVRHELDPVQEAQMLDDLKQSLLDCRDRMDREVTASKRFESMNTTLTLAYVVWPRAYLVHVGNNRAYHASDGSLKRLTCDHTMAQRLKRAGIVGPRRAAKSEMNSVLWNALGTTGAKCAPDSCVIDLKVGDAIVLCTDGVSMTIEEEEIFQALREEEDAAATCQRILPSVEDQPDDATVVVARFLEMEKQDVAEARFTTGQPDNVQQKVDKQIVHKLPRVS